MIAARVAGVPRGQFRAGTDHWVATPEFLAFARDTPIPALVAGLLGSDQVWLYEDSVLVKEPDTPERTVFHQDLAYFHIDGDQVCTVWIPLDHVDETGQLMHPSGGGVAELGPGDLEGLRRVGRSEGCLATPDVP